MDPFEIKKRLFEGMGQYAQDMRAKNLRGRYAPAKKPQVAPVPGAPSEDDMQATIDSVQPPPTDGGAEGKATLQILKAQAPLNSKLADKITEDNKSVLAGLRDEELERLLNTRVGEDDELLEMLNTKY